MKTLTYTVISAITWRTLQKKLLASNIDVALNLARARYGHHVYVITYAEDYTPDA